MACTEAHEIAFALEPSPSGWESDQADAHDAIVELADEMLDAGMHPLRIQELLDQLLSAALGEMG